jgi:hypothetical protein
MTWKAPFDEPIRLESGKTLRTLADAANHVIALPLRETKRQDWQTAMSCLLAAAEKRGPLMMARIATVKALASRESSPSERLRAAKKFQIVRPFE